MSSVFAKILEAAKKKKAQSEPKNQTTATSSPLRGANQDYSGTNVKNDTADYTISDSYNFGEGMIAGVGDIRNKPANMGQGSGTVKTRNSPKNVGTMQNAANQRVVQLDRAAQQQKDQQEKDREMQTKQREQAAKKDQAKLVKKAPMQEKANLPGHEVEPLEGTHFTYGPDGKPAKRRSTVQIINSVIKKNPEHMPVKEASEEKPPFEGPYDKDQKAKDKNVAKHAARKAMKQMTKEELEEAKAAMQGLKQRQKASSDREHKKTHGISPKRFAIKQTDMSKPQKHKVDVHVVTSKGEDRKYQDEVHAKDKHAAIFKTQRKYEDFGKKMGYSVNKVVHKGMVKEEEIIEAKKEAEARDLGDRHIIMQARKVISTRGAHHITFANGKTHAVSPGTAHRLISHHDNLAKPADKEAFAAHAHSSLEGMKDALAGKKPESKPAISLGGSKNVGGSKNAADSK